MDKVRQRNMIVRWPCLMMILTWLFWWIWSFFAPVPVISELTMTPNWTYELPIDVPRWWDIPFAGIFTVLILIVFFTFIKNNKHNENSITGLIVGLIVGPFFGLIVGLIYGLIFGLIYGLIFGPFFGLIFGPGFGLGVGLGVGLGAGLGVGLGAGLGIVLGEVLIVGLGVGLGVGLNILRRKSGSVSHSIKQYLSGY